jgi:ketosteroid isomerase-like protein
MSDSAQVVTQAYDAFSRGDIPSLLELVADDVRWEVPEIVPQGGSFEGREGVDEFFAGIAREWPELKVEIEELIAEGDNVVAVGRAKGRLNDGHEVAYGFTHVFTIADGKVARFREYVALDASLR